MLEIEIKSPCDDYAAVIEKLASLGARRTGKKKEYDRYLNHPARDFKNSDEALRVRQVDERIVLTYKGPKIGTVSKTRIEEEVTVGDIDAILSILRLLGFSESGMVVKERETFVLGDIAICIDNVEGLGNFVELETKGTDRERLEQELLTLAGQLGLNRLERKSYLEMKYGNDLPKE
ncbi:MAG: hypothetical protein A2176_08315 [Spirochaetes bacterium RBG_13_51_14]|nr:MAG: hypothetical protein A2176_08315 [Spirochaetes bacterium RBG_13_51_14]